MTETRITNEKTGGQKGQKPEQMSLLPIEALQAVSRVYGFGAEKYERQNWRKGYDWHLSYDAMQRHLQSFWSGEDTDPESGESHLAHAVFHCFTLMTFVDDYPEGDDRYVVADDETFISLKETFGAHTHTSWEEVKASRISGEGWGTTPAAQNYPLPPLTRPRPDTVVDL